MNSTHQRTSGGNGAVVTTILFTSARFRLRGAKTASFVARIILLIVLAYEVLGYLWCGGLLVAAPDGHLMDMDLEGMGGFFPDFFIPGLLLIGLGLLNLAAFIAVWRRTRTDWVFLWPGVGRPHRLVSG